MIIGRVKNRNLIVIIAIILSLLIFNKIDKPKKATQNKKETQVITYTPEDLNYPKNEAEADCNQTSTATQGRPKTYRCYSDNKVYDPCFKLELDKVVCDSNPKVSGGEFEFTSFSELPADNISYNENKRFEWAYELEDKTICFLIQGTAGTLSNGEMYYYSCEDNKVIIGDIDTSNLLWTAQVSKLDGDLPENPIEVTQMNILRVWK